MAAKKLNDDHKVYICQRYASYQADATEIAEDLASLKIAEEHEFEAVDISHVRVHQIIKAESEKIADLRSSYLADFSELPLAFKKMRLMELVKMYNSIAKGALTKKLIGNVEVVCSDLETTKQMQSILRDMKAEMGEDVEKLADAMRNRNGDTYHITQIIGEAKAAKPEKRSIIVGNAIAGLGGFISPN